jgi:hypothetical protein
LDTSPRVANNCYIALLTQRDNPGILCFPRIILIFWRHEEILVILLEKTSECPTCQHCGAEIKIDMDKDCPGCHRDVKECVIDKDVTSSIYPM